MMVMVPGLEDEPVFCVNPFHRKQNHNRKQNRMMRRP